MGKLDTKKLDHIDVRPQYRVGSTAEAHDQRGQQNEQQERDEYSEPGGGPSWQKYNRDEKDRRALKLRRQDISRLSFNQVFLHKGLVIIDADVELINRQLIRNAHLFSTKIDVYWKLKNLSQKAEIPIQQFIKEEYVEISVLQRGNVVKAERAENPQGKDERKVEEKKGFLNSLKRIFYG